jgi:hypothetical protein
MNKLFQTKPIFRKPKMNLTNCVTGSYSDNSGLPAPKKQSQTKPNFMMFALRIRTLCGEIGSKFESMLLNLTCESITIIFCMGIGLTIGRYYYAKSDIIYSLISHTQKRRRSG